MQAIAGQVVPAEGGDRVPPGAAQDGLLLLHALPVFVLSVYAKMIISVIKNEIDAVPLAGDPA